MLKIGFIQATGDDSRSYGIPLAFGYLISVLNREWDQPFDYRVTAEPYDLVEYQPDLIAVSSVSSCFWQVPEYAALFRDRLPETRIVMGGHHISALPHQLPAAIDVGVIGEGEDTFLDLVRRFGPGVGWPEEQLRETPGICYHGRTGGVIVTDRRAPRPHLDTLPFPVRSVNPTRPDEAVIFTSRGCPFRCTYCSTQHHWRGFRRFSAAYVVRELEHIAHTSPNVRSVYILDDLFVADRKRLRELARLIERSGLNRRLALHGFVRSNLVDDDLCKLLKTMNVRAIRFGAESGSDAVLHRMERGGKCSVATHQRAIDLAHKHGLACGASFMFGFPGETRADMRQTFEFIHRNVGKMTVEGCYLTVPLPGAELWQWAVQEGRVSEQMDWRRLNLSFDNPEFDWKNFLYLNEQCVPRREFVRAILESGVLPEPVARLGRDERQRPLAAERMLHVMESLAALGVRRVALYGAGEHTRRLKDQLRGAPVTVVAILDDNLNLHGTHLGPFKIHAPDNAAKLDIDAVILSSDRAEQALWERRALFEQIGIPVHRLYGADNQGDGAAADVPSRSTHAVADCSVDRRISPPA